MLCLKLSGRFSRSSSMFRKEMNILLVEIQTELLAMKEKIVDDFATLPLCARDFSTQGFFAICFPGFLIEFYANKCYPMFQLLEFYMMTKNHFCKLK